MDTHPLLEIIVRLDSYILLEDVIMGWRKGFHIEVVFKEICTHFPSNYNNSL